MAPVIELEPPFAPTTIETCDHGLRLLRVLRREGNVEERQLAQLAIDELLDVRLDLMAAR